MDDGYDTGDMLDTLTSLCRWADDGGFTHAEDDEGGYAPLIFTMGDDGEWE